MPLCRNRVLDPLQPVSENAEMDPNPTLFQPISDVHLAYTLNGQLNQAAIYDTRTEGNAMTHEPQKDTLEDILSTLQDEQETVRQHSLQRLHAYFICAGGPMENGTITQAAKEAGDKAVTQQLQDREIVPLLLGAMEDTSARIRACTALVLGHVTNAEAQEALIQHLQDDPAHQVRHMCVAGLRNRSNSQRKMQGLIAALQDEHYTVVFPACLSLGQIGDPQAIEPLRCVLSHSSWNVRFYACQALVRLNSVNLPVVNLLEELTQQPEAQQHNELMQKVNKLTDSEGQAQTVQTVLDQARRLLSP